MITGERETGELQAAQCSKMRGHRKSIFRLQTPSSSCSPSVLLSTVWIPRGAFRCIRVRLGDDIFSYLKLVWYEPYSNLGFQSSLLRLNVWFYQVNHISKIFSTWWYFQPKSIKLFLSFFPLSPGPIARRSPTLKLKSCLHTKRLELFCCLIFSNLTEHNYVQL